MKLDVQALLADLKAKALPIAEKDLIIVVDSVLNSVASQAAAQPGDLVADGLAIVIPAVKPAIDAELAKLLPDAAQV